VLKYAYQLLTLEHTTSLPSDLQVKESDLQVKESDENLLGLFTAPDTYCIVLFNDETHTFEQVR
jgi:E3 ubiquitin-protein ligase UBR2